MFCPQCGKPVADGARFCGNCGATIAATTPPAPPAFTPPPAPVPPAAAVASPTTGTLGAAGAAAGPSAASTGASAGSTGTYASPGAVPPTGAAVEGLVARVKGILLAPKTEWPIIAAETRTARDIYLGYVAPLAAIGALASFIGGTLVGVTVPLLGTVRVPIVAGIAGAITHYALTFLMVFLVALIVDALAPTFGGQKDSVRALKVTAYSFTAGWIAGIVAIIPMLGFLALIGALYGLYLLYLGLPVMMRSPPDKSVGYTVVIVICAIVLGMITSIATGALVGAFGMGAAGIMGRTAPSTADAGNDAAAAIVSKMMGGQSSADQARMKEAIGTLQKMGEQSDAAERVAKAQGGDPSAAGAKAVDMGAALNAVGTMMGGGKDVQPVDFHELKDMLPASLPGLARGEASGQSGEAMGVKGSSATARYAEGNTSITIEIEDLGSLAGLAGMAAKLEPRMEKETATGYERTRQVSGQLVHERYDRQSKDGETSVLVGGRFNVTVRGHGVDSGQLTAALQAVDLARLPKLAAAR